MTAEKKGYITTSHFSDGVEGDRERAEYYRVKSELAVVKLRTGLRKEVIKACGSSGQTIEDIKLMGRRLNVII